MTLKIRRSIVSLIVLTMLAGIMLVTSAGSESGTGTIPTLYLWVKLESLLSAGGAILLIALRLFRIINPETNFLYTFLAIANTVLGVGGVSFYVLHKINLVGLHTLLLNLLIGVILLTDIFLFDAMIRRE